MRLYWTITHFFVAVIASPIITNVAGSSSVNQGADPLALWSVWPSGACVWSGGGDGGPATTAALCDPTAIIVRGNDTYILDGGYNRVRRVNATGGIVTIVGHGDGATKRLN